MARKIILLEVSDVTIYLSYEVIVYSNAIFYRILGLVVSNTTKVAEAIFLSSITFLVGATPHYLTAHATTAESWTRWKWRWIYKR